MKSHPYYEAYDQRYRQVHQKSLNWTSDEPTELVTDTIKKYQLTTDSNILEIGCGEGRDAINLLANHYRLLATDVSVEAISFCQKKYPNYAKNFMVMDCLNSQIDEKYDFIYAIAVLHMLVEDEDRKKFYQFIDQHLNPNGIALIGTMGDGINNSCTDPTKAYELTERIHQSTGQPLMVAATSCKMVSFEVLEQEINEGNLQLVESGITEVPPHFSSLMFAVVKKGNRI